MLKCNLFTKLEVIRKYFKASYLKIAKSRKIGIFLFIWKICTYETGGEICLFTTLLSVYEKKSCTNGIKIPALSSLLLQLFHGRVMNFFPSVLVECKLKPEGQGRILCESLMVQSKKKVCPPSSEKSEKVNQTHNSFFPFVTQFEIPSSAHCKFLTRSLAPWG